MQTPTATPRTSAPRPSRYNAFKVRRCCRLIEVDASRIAHFACYSFTREGREIRHQPAIDLTTGAVSCTCENFSFKCARHNPTVFSATETRCKHIERAIGVARKHDMLPQIDSPACIHCGGEGEFEVCDEHGFVVRGAFICRGCITARVDDLSDATPAQSTLGAPAHVDATTGEILPGWFQVEAPALGFEVGQWITQAMWDAARAATTASVLAADPDLLDIID